MSKKKVYVSSTLLDLKEHRHTVKTALERAQYDVESMERYPAFDERPADKCLGDVAGCDYYVLILAHRYGFIPSHDNLQKKSITHLEYEQAIASRKPVLAFLVDENHHWPPRLIDSGSLDPSSRIGALRHSVALRHGTGFFSTPDNLAAQVLEALRAQEEEERRERPKSALAALRWPSPWDFTAYLESKREGFVGRDWLFAEIQEWLASGPQRALLIRADFGVGKSAIMAELVRRNPNGAVVAWHFCQHDTRETLQPATFVRSLAAQFRETIPEYRKAIEADTKLLGWLDSAQDDPSSAFELAILNVLAKLAPPAEPHLLLVDALDEGLELAKDAARRYGTIVSLLAAKAARIPTWLRVLATSRNNPAVIGPLQHAFGLRQIDAEEARNLDDLTNYVQARCRQDPIASKLAAGHQSAGSVAALLRARSGGKFLYAVRALNDLVNGTLAPRDLKHLPPGMDGFYLDAFERRFGVDAERYEPVRNALGVLAAAREPLAPATLGAILAGDETAVKRALAAIPDFIRVLHGHYTFDHFSFAEWLTLENEQFIPRAACYAVNLPASADRIRAWALAEVKDSRAHMQPYLVRHLAAHLHDGERPAIFAALMRDPYWLHAKAIHSGTQGLLTDCALLPHTDGFRLLSTALRNSVSAIARDSRQIVPQLLGRLAGSAAFSEIDSLCKSLRSEIRHFIPLMIPETASLRVTSELLNTFHGHEDSVTALAVLPDGRVASSSYDGTVRVYDAADHAKPVVLHGHKNGVSALAVLSDGRIASGSGGNTVYVWDAAAHPSAPVILHGHKNRITALAALPDGRIASASDDETVRVWDATGRAEPVILHGHKNRVTALAALPDGRIASASDDETVRVWDAAERAEPLVLHGHENIVTALAALPNGRIASGSWDKTVRVWDAAGRSEPVVLHGHENGVTALAVLPDGRIASASWDKTVRVWDAASCCAEPVILHGHEAGVRALTVLPDDRIASASSDRTVRIWNTGTGAMVALFVADGIVGELLAPSTGLIIAGDDTGAVHFLRLVE